MILSQIVTHKRQELTARQRATPLAELKAQAADQPPPLCFASALCGADVRLVAEIKRASPSRGVLCPHFDPVSLAMTYAANGAAAISVLTDGRFFQGQPEHLLRIKSTLRDKGSPIPVMRKDFVLDPYQVYETRALGADALLLIVAILTDGMLAELLDVTHALGMTALVEVHDEEEMSRALRLRPRVVGVNNRNLQDFSVDLNTFGRLSAMMPDHVVSVSESGVHTAADVHRLAAMGADAVLVGEALVTAPDVAAKVRELAGGGGP